MSITTAPQSGGFLSRIDAYRFYIMAAIGLLLIGFIYIQKNSTSPVDDEVSEMPIPHKLLIMLYVFRAPDL
jgi:hypothetical protein